MVLNKRRWHVNHIYAVYRFRKVFQEKATSHKTDHLWNKVEQHMDSGEKLGLTFEEMKRFNLAIISEISKGKEPKSIIQELLKNNSQ